MGLKDVTGMKFGRLTAVRRSEDTADGRVQWVCVCECDQTREVVVRSEPLRKGNTRSCGCLFRETRATTRRTHGGSYTKEFRSWSHAKNRCTNRLNTKWKDYGGRGITMCARWRDDFAAFRDDMGECPSTSHSIDRIDNDGHYSCGKCDDCRTRGLVANCRWATYIEQARNKRNSVLVRVGDESVTIPELSDRTGINEATIRNRVRKNATIDAVTDPNVDGLRRVIVGPDGTSRRLHEWATISGVSASTILWRIDNGWSEALAASTPKTHRYRPAERKQ